MNHRKETTSATSLMATEALAALRPRQLFDVVEAHIEARGDLDPGMLEAFADRLRRRAWAIERERKR